MDSNSRALLRHSGGSRSSSIRSRNVCCGLSPDATKWRASYIAPSEVSTPLALPFFKDALFDFGYLAEAYKQWLGDSHNPAAGLDGHALIEEAIQLRGNDPQMELAAALVTLSGPASQHQAHAQNAIAGAKMDPLLARNLARHFVGDQGPTIAEMLTKTTVAERKP